jgi:hypothetical protein
MRRGAVRVAGVASVLVGAWLAVSSLAATTGPIEWTSPSPILPSSLVVETSTQYTPAALSCRGVSLCVAGTEGGDALASATPTLPGRAWNVKLVDAAHGLTAVACPSTSLCVATDSAGDALTSEDPAVEAPTWSTAAIDGSTSIAALSCPSIEMCVAADAMGRILVSEDPQGGPQTWHAALVDAANAPITGLSCPSSAMCVAADNYGDVLTSEEPGGGPGAWSIARVDSQHQLEGGVSCPSERFCATIDSAGNLVASTNPLGGPSAWNVAPGPSGQLLRLISCPSASLCVATGFNGQVAVTSEPAAAHPTWVTAPIDAERISAALTCNVQLTCISLDEVDNAMIASGLAPVQALGVSLAGSGHGTVLATEISCPPSCSTSYPTGSAIALIATAAVGSSFAGWAGDCSGVGRCTVVMDSPRSVMASFTANDVGPRASLAVSLGGLGDGRVTGAGINCPPTCWTTITSNAAVQLNATALGVSSFAGWGGAALACGRRSNCSITVAGAQEVKATFTTGRSPPLRITRVTVERARHAARIDFSTRPPVARVTCILSRVESRRRRSIFSSRRCRTPVIYKLLRSGRYMLTLEAFPRTQSAPIITIDRRFAL